MMDRSGGETREALRAVPLDQTRHLGQLLPTVSPGPHLLSLVGQIRAAAADRSPSPELRFSAFRQFADTGNRIRYEQLYFRRRARLVALAAEALVDDKAPASALEDILWSTCDEYTWALPAHLSGASHAGRDSGVCADLFACETAHTLGETVAAHAERLDDRVTARVIAEIDRRVITPFEDTRRMWWEGNGNNWEAVCAGAAGMAAIALLPDGSRLEQILDRCVSAMERFLAGYGDDGGCAEGVHYWSYGFGYFVYFSEQLRQRTGRDLLDNPKVAQIAAFPQRAMLSDGAYVPFSDTSLRPALPAGLIAKLAERFGTVLPDLDPRIDDDPCYRWGHLSRTLAWWTPPRQRVSPETVTYLADLAWVIDRQQYAFAAKGGHNGEPHNHNDLGSFVLHVDGQNFLDDLGAGEYTRSYFGAERYKQLHPSAEAHSIPIIDGHVQVAGHDGTATMVAFEATSDGVQFELELVHAYDVPGLRSLVRRFDWNRSNGLILVDHIIADRDLDLDELFISRKRPRLDTETAVWSNRVQLRFTALDAAVERIETTDHQGRPDTVYRLRLRGRAPSGASTHRFEFTVLDRN